MGILYERSKLSPPYSEEEDAILHAYYAIEGPKGCAERLQGRKAINISTRAKKLGLFWNDPKKWTSEEEDILRTYYPIEGKQILSRLPGRTLSTITQHAQKQNIRVSDFYWSDQDDEVLKQFYPTLGYQIQAMFPNKQMSAIAARTQRLGLSAPNSKPKEVICVETGDKYPSCAEAMRQTGFSTIDSCVRKKCKTAGGYHWCYTDDLEQLNKLQGFIGEKHILHYRIKCVETGEVFRTLRDAAISKNANADRISNICKKSQSQMTSGGYHWEYVEEE